MSKNTPNTDTRPLECELYIVHDKKTKPIAVGIYNKLASKCKCAHWDEETYAYNENRATNANRFLFLSEKLIEENLAPELTSETPLAEHVTLVGEGNMFGIVPHMNEAPFIDKKILKKDIKEHVKLFGLNGVMNLYYLIMSHQNSIRMKLLFDGVQYLLKDDNYKLIIKD